MADFFEDERGTILDLLVTQLDSVTRIYTRKGHIRGNHIHRQTTQWTYILEGQLLIRTGSRERSRDTIYEPGDLACEPPGVAHAWKALMNTEVLVFTQGPRSGDGYENDTIRLDDPLLP